ncbi:MAG: hypothetical protein M3Q70_03165 [bacterium]|nr:hypothetical protein [bacterium]
MSEFIGPRFHGRAEKHTLRERIMTPIIVIGAAAGTIALEACVAGLNLADKLQVTATSQN